jgi:predicted outer membrane protein
MQGRMQGGVGGRRRAMVLAAGAFAAVFGAAACQNTGDHRDEAPGQGAAAEGTVDRNAGAATSASGGVNAGPNAPNNDRDTTALPGVAGSGTAGVGRPSGAPGQPGAGTLHTGDPDDASVQQVIAAIHKGEVDAAQLALSKSQNAAVRSYAQNMLRVHEAPSRGAPPPQGAAASRASDLLVPLEEYNTKTVAALRAAPAAGFDRAYITSQVASHGGALQTLTRLETAAKDDALTDRIRALKGEVQRHLEEARRLQSTVAAGT